MAVFVLVIYALFKDYKRESISNGQHIYNKTEISQEKKKEG